VRRRESRRRFRELAKTVDLICRRIVAREAYRSPTNKSGNHASALSQRFNRRHGRADGRTFGKRDRRLHEIIRSLARDGKSVVLISHFLSEVLALADVITTLRDGHLIRTTDAKDATEES